MPSPASRSPENLVLLHGMFGHSAQWQFCAGQVSAPWRVTSPCLPLLDVTPDDAVLDALGEGIVQQMDCAGMERAVVGGNSLGGHIAMRMALNYPHRIEALVLTGSSGLFERGFDGRVPRRPDENWIRTKMTEVFHDPVHVTDGYVQEVRVLLSDGRRLLHMVRLARQARRDNLRTLLPDIHCPVLLVWGRQDEITPAAVAEEFHRLLPRSELHFIEQCGHVPMLEQPDTFYRLLSSFLARLPAKRPAESRRPSRVPA